MSKKEEVPLVYNYSAETGEFTSSQPARLDPREEKTTYRLPANATFEAIGADKKGFTQVFEGGKWVYVEDHRGKTAYDTEDFYAAPYPITKLGKLPANKSTDEAERAEFKPDWDYIKGVRKGLLSASDWTQLLDSPLSAADKTKWADYRQKLRDITEDFKKPEDVTFPETP